MLQVLYLILQRKFHEKIGLTYYTGSTDHYMNFNQILQIAEGHVSGIPWQWMDPGKD